MVDNISKPFTFTANTYAKASEVNADFDTLYTGVNACVNQINSNITDINNLDTNKADVNGNSTQRFSVADATVNTDAINKQSLMKYISNSLDYISGLVVSKDSSSPNDTIMVSPGSCYDSTKNVMLSLQNNTTKQNENQGPSVTYYIYIIGNSTGSSTDILISTNNIEPTLPVGYTLYRQIGNYTTNSENKIQMISSYGGNQELDPYSIESICFFATLSGGVDQTLNFASVPINTVGIKGTNSITIAIPGTYLLLCNGFRINNRGGADQLEIRINGTVFVRGQDDNDAAMFPSYGIKKLSIGDIVTVYANNVNLNDGNLSLVRIGE